MKRTLIPLCYYFLFLATGLYAFDNPHFFRTRLFPGEPRLVRQGLFTFDFVFDGGSAFCSRNACHHKVPLFDLYGTHNLLRMGVNVPNKDPFNPIDNLLDQLSTLPQQKCFGHLSLGGCLNIREAAFDGYYNFRNGLFAHLYLPIRSFTIDNVTICDLSSTSTTVLLNRDNALLQQARNSFGAILDRFHLALAPHSIIGMGAMAALIGWTHNEEERTQCLDFVDATFEIGLLFPTGKKTNPHFVISLPTGYNGHVGIPLIVRASMGAYDWLTLGGSIEGRIFFDKTACVRMKTAIDQQGLIILAEGIARRHLGSLWSFDLFAKADHVFKGLSFLFGYTYDHQRHSTLHPCSPLFDCQIVNSDNALGPWSMHSLHLLIDYDFAYDDRPWGPRIGIIYSHQVSGKRVINEANVGGMSLGIDLVYCW